VLGSGTAAFLKAKEFDSVPDGGWVWVGWVVGEDV